MIHPELPTLENEALAAAMKPDGELDVELYRIEYEKRLAERHQRLMHDARAVFRSMGGWDLVRTPVDWDATVKQAHQDFDTGQFLIERLGAARYLDPPLMAVLLSLRRRLIDEHGATTAAELILIDSIVLAYYHQMRATGWIGDLAQYLESEFFRKESLTAKFRDEYGRTNGQIRGLKVEDIVERLVEKIMPLLDRSNRLLLRNLQALKALRDSGAPTVAIGQAAQVNVGTQQVNAVNRTGRRKRVNRSPG